MLTKAIVCRNAGVPREVLEREMAAGRIFGPSVEGRYTEHEAELVIAHLRMAYNWIDDEKSFCMTEAAQELGIQEDTFRDYIRAGHLPGPTHKLRGPRLYYTFTEVEELKEIFPKVILPQNGAYHRKRQEHGYYSQSAAAAHCGVRPICLRHAIAMGHVPPPTHRLGIHYYYLREDLVALVEYFAQLHSIDYLHKTEMAKIVGICQSYFATLLKTGVLPQPRHKIGARHYYHKNDVEEVNRAWTIWRKNM